MILQLNNINTKVLEGTNDEIRFLTKYLTFVDASSRFMQTDGVISLYNPRTSSFPSGLLTTLQSRALAEGLKIEVMDARVEPIPGYTIPTLPPHLYSYQKEAVQAALRAKRSLISISTGGGKSVVASALVGALPVKTLLLTHRTTLLHQLADSFKKFTGMEAGKIGDKNYDYKPRFTIAMIPTLLKKAKIPVVKQWLSEVECVLVDECHISASPSVAQLLQLMPRAYFRVGLSATPLARGDNKSVIVVGHFGKVCYRIHTRELIDLGYLAEPTVRFIENQQQYFGDVSTGPGYLNMYEECVVNSQSRNLALLRAMQMADPPGFVFVTQTQHGQNLMDLAIAANIPVRYIDGEANTLTRQEAVAQLVRGDYKFLITTKIFQEGLDVPSLRSVIMGGGGKSVIAELQMLGRGSRITPQKNVFDLWEIYDMGIPMLHRHAKIRIKALQQETYKILSGSAEEFYYHKKQSA